ncbi:MAG: polysaccharide pyruvyl transferase CsaB [Firmicutes bacterium]|nr:polysaccharide pyruvyl transferase CsaB [Bacillota bacterium]
MNRSTEKKGIVICGAYGLGNCGDEAILDAVITEVRECAGAAEITVISRSPKETSKLHGVSSVWSFDIIGIARALKRCAVFISGGGSLLQDITSSRSLYYYLAVIRLAKRLGCRVLMYGCGIGPINKDRNRKAAAKVITECADCITLRDAKAMAELEALGASAEDIRLSADPALSLDPISGQELARARRALGIEDDERYLMISPMDPPDGKLPDEAIAAAAGKLYGERQIKTVFLCLGEGDSAAAERIAELMTTPYLIIKEGLPFRTVLGIVSGAEAMLSARLHALIFAAAAGVPSAALSTDPKVSGFLEDLGTGEVSDPASATADSLAAAVEAAMAQDRAELKERAGELRRREQTNARVLSEYMERAGIFRRPPKAEGEPVRLAIFTSDFRVGGMQKSLINLLKNLDCSRCTADVYYYDGELFYDLPVREGIRYIKLEPRPYWYRFVYFGLLMRFAKDPAPGKHYDVSVDFNSYQNECALYACSASAEKRVMFIHNDVKRKLAEEPRYRVLWHFFKGKFAYYDEFAAVSSGIVESFRECSHTKAPIWIVPNYIDTEEIFRKADQPLVFRFDQSKYNLCAVGRLCHQKGFDILLDIFAQAAEMRPDLHLYIIGDGPDRDALRVQTRDLGIDFRTTFLGRQSNPYAYMERMDGLALTSRYEGQGMVVMEGKALGLDLYISKNLEEYNQGIHCTDDIVQALLVADKKIKTRDSLEAYNNNITRQLNRIFGLDEGDRP